ncbi:hypothetical protein [Prosthecobacter sp.]|uniref:hypothetical protein n=1 Tax=Prosthecobacter sp. TaxID=1965333 RepID=UPI003783D883
MRTRFQVIRLAALVSSLTLLTVYVINSQFKRRTVIHSHSNYPPANDSPSTHRTVTPADERRLMLPGSKVPLEAVIPAQQLEKISTIWVFPIVPDTTSGSAGSATTPPSKP